MTANFMKVVVLTTLLALSQALELLNPVNEGGKDVVFVVSAQEAPFLKFLKNAAGDAVLSDVKLETHSKGFSFMLDAKKASPGLYKLQVTEGQNSKVFHATLTGEFELQSAIIQGKKMAFGEKMKKQRLVSASSDEFSIEISTAFKESKETASAHQAFVVFKQDDVDATFMLTPSNKKTMVAKINVGSESKKFAHKSGTYSVKLIVGGPSFSNVVEWALGSVELSLGAAPLAAPSPLYAKPLLHESDITMKPLPEISHLMRPQDTRPSAIVSNFFTGLVIVPLVGFVLFLLRWGLNFSKVPGGLGPFWALGFIASLGSILVLFYVYWVRLTMFKTLGYLSVLSVVTILFGHKSLSGLSNDKLNVSNKLKTN